MLQFPYQNIIAIFYNEFSDCVELLVLDETDNLKFSYLAFDGGYVPTTPFRELIKHMPGNMIQHTPNMQ